MDKLKPRPDRRLSAVERLRGWAVGPVGRRLFAWGAEGDLERCAAFFRGKLPDAILADWCRGLRELALR